jgi:CRP/FNR family transcriptional regulator
MKVLGVVQRHEKCGECTRRGDHFFCSLPDDTLAELHSIAVTHHYSKGTTLFIEGQAADGVFVLCTGRVKLSTYSEDGKAIILRIGEAGEVLGLSSSMCDGTYEATAQVLESCKVHYIRRRDFVAFVRGNGDAALNAIRELSRNYHQAYTQICSLGLSSSVGDKLARLFLEWHDRYANGAADAHILMDYTHEEIAEMIGTSRETVTRLLKDFRNRKLITLDHSNLYIPDRRKLAAAVGTNCRSVQM